MRVLPVRGCHPLWPGVPAGSGSDACATGLVRVRSPLLAESRLMSFPPGTEMFQFPGFASAAYRFSGGSPMREGLPHSEIPGSQPARGFPGLIAACHVLHRLLAPRHPPDALAFLAPRQRQPHPHPATSTDVPGTGYGRRRRQRFQRQLRTTTGHPPHRRRMAAYPCQDVAARRRKTKRRADDVDLPVPGRRAARGLPPPCPRAGHLVTTTRCPTSTGPAAMPDRPGPQPPAPGRGRHGTPGGPGPT